MTKQSCHSRQGQDGSRSSASHVAPFREYTQRTHTHTQEDRETDKRARAHTHTHIHIQTHTHTHIDEPTIVVRMTSTGSCISSGRSFDVLGLIAQEHGLYTSDNFNLLAKPELGELCSNSSSIRMQTYTLTLYLELGEPDIANGRFQWFYCDGPAYFRAHCGGRHALRYSRSDGSGHYRVVEVAAPVLVNASAARSRLCMQVAVNPKKLLEIGPQVRHGGSAVDPDCGSSTALPLLSFHVYLFYSSFK